MADKPIFEAIGYESEDCTKEKGKIYFSTEELAVQFVGKHLKGQGYVRPRFVKSTKVYKSLEEYENDLYELDI